MRCNRTWAVEQCDYASRSNDNGDGGEKRRIRKFFQPRRDETGNQVAERRADKPDAHHLTEPASWRELGHRR